MFSFDAPFPFEELVVIDTYEDVLQMEKGRVLALDISQNSTGYALWDKGVLTTGTFATEIPPKGDVLYNYKLAMNFKKQLESLVPSGYYDLIVIEDIFGGQYLNTYKVLSTLAMGFDIFVTSDHVTYGSYMKVDNRQWKSELRKLAGKQGKVYLKDKEDIEESLTMLGVTEEVLGGTSGKQDQRDALGLLLTGICKLKSPDKAPQVRYRLEYHLMNKDQLGKSRRAYELITSPHGKTYVHNKEDLEAIASKEGQWYVIEVNSLGMMGIEKGHPEVIGGPNYIMFRKRETK